MIKTLREISIFWWLFQEENEQTKETETYLLLLTDYQ